MSAHKKQRLEILQLLYAQREAKPKQGWVNLSDLKKAVGDCDFALVYLIERGYVAENGYQYRVTACGIDVSERRDD